MLTASIMSGPVGMFLAVTSMALLSVSFKFTAPVKPGTPYSWKQRFSKKDKVKNIEAE